ncbi:hypothetical protein RvY_12510-2 [Ramazzottius varieornatus]|uniref:Alpha-methylacyl-CoA racemase n=1 Tax=Ramazzottius varieornatus TaxID=947166 RepID=A0A1D1VJT4_RAMVA|nr:hypothetical protein RvY_12510-2 [Ramazzottius varieornatus]
MPLRGLQVLELAGLAPAPFCGMVLSDFGASVIRMDRLKTKTFHIDRLNRGKKALAVDYTRADGRNVFLDLCRNSDVLIDPFRPGVMEAHQLGPKDIQAVNERLIYARLSGYGQEGPMSAKAGHDINFLSLSGVLSKLGPDEHSRPRPPLNLLADFGGGGLLCAFGILAAVIGRISTAKGQVVDAKYVKQVVRR